MGDELILLPFKYSMLCVQKWDNTYDPEIVEELETVDDAPSAR